MSGKISRSGVVFDPVAPPLRTSQHRFALKKFGLAFLCGAILWSCGCSGSSGGVAGGDAPGGAAPVDFAKGTVEVHLANPETGVIPDELNRPLVILGVNDDHQVTFGPVTIQPGPVANVEGVPVGTTQFIIEDPSNPRLVDVHPVHVQGGEVSSIVDIMLHEDRGTDGAEALTGQARVEAGPPIHVGKNGFIQTSPSTIGTPGANAVMTGYETFSATAEMKPPFQTNTWVIPMLGGDNSTRMHLGNSAGKGEKPVYDPNRYVDQKPAYAKPWVIWFRVPVLPFNPAKIDPGDRSAGLLLSPEDPRAGAGYEWAGPDGDGTDDNPLPRSGKKAAEINAQMDVGLNAIKVDPGFFPARMRVKAISDLHAEFVMKAAEDPDYQKKGFKSDASLSVTLLRGSPIAYFRTFGIGKINFILRASNTVETKSGQVTIGTNKTVINWIETTGSFDVGGRKLTFLFLVPATVGTFTPSTGADNILTMPVLDKARFFAVVTLPDSSFIDDKTIVKLSEAAFNFPTDSRVTSTYDPVNQTVDETYNVTLSTILATVPKKTLLGLLPHHYDPSVVEPGVPVLQGSPPVFSSSAGKAMTYPTTRGDLKVFDANTVTCRFRYPGILPYLPGELDAADKTTFDTWVDTFKRRHGADSPPYTNIFMNSSKKGVGQDSYNLAKFLGRNVSAANVIEDVGKDDASKALAKLIRDNSKAAIEIFYRATPDISNQENIGQAPYYLYYDTRVKSLNQYPSLVGGPSVLFPNIPNEMPWDGFGTITRLNDHHFHFGYFIYAAAQIALRDKDWGQDWKDAINQMIFDCAHESDVNPNPILEFPRMRNWDPYENHSYAAGFNWDVFIGNNEESISEEMNFWAGVILWGAATDQPLLVQHGIKYYTMAAYTSNYYWLDAGNKWPAFIAKLKSDLALNWPGTGMVRLFDGFSRWDTFFGSHPIQCRGILMIPITTASFYQAMLPGYTKTVGDQYQDFVTALNIDPQKPKGNEKFSVKNQWIGVCLFYAHLAKYYALSDPDNAITKFYDVPANYDEVGGIRPNDKWTDIGDSGVYTFHFIKYLQKHGTPDFTVRATNTPFFQVLKKGASKTYLAYNSGSSVLKVTFSDGTSFDVPARSLGSTTKP